MAMRAVEPIVRKPQQKWLSAMVPWLTDETKWVQRTSVFVVGRLSIKHADYTQ